MEGSKPSKLPWQISFSLFSSEPGVLLLISVRLRANGQSGEAAGQPHHQR